MDTQTGKIYDNKEWQDLKKEVLNAEQRFIEIEANDMTAKQKENKQVSLHDNKSKLGKILQEKRKELGYSKMTKNQKRNIRKKLKAGLGI